MTQFSTNEAASLQKSHASELKKLKRNRRKTEKESSTQHQGKPVMAMTKACSILTKLA